MGISYAGSALQEGAVPALLTSSLSSGRDSKAQGFVQVDSQEDVCAACNEKRNQCCPVTFPPKRQQNLVQVPALKQTKEGIEPSSTPSHRNTLSPVLHGSRALHSCFCPKAGELTL